MNGFIGRLLGKKDPVAKLVRDELACARSVESFCNELLSVEEDEAKRLYLNDLISRVASLRYQARCIRIQTRSLGLIRRFYDDEKFATVEYRNLESIDKLQKDSSEMRRRFATVIR